MAPVDHRLLCRAAVIGLLAAVVGLAGCGRKGPLEAPPGLAMKDASGNPVPATAPAKPNKPFFLDPLIK